MQGSLAIMSALTTSPGRAFAAANPADGAGPEMQRSNGLVTLFLAGDVMVGRGIDQILPHPSDPKLYEPYIKSALEYVEIAETANGAIPRPVNLAYVWGDALPELARARPDVRVVNLETAITSSDAPAPKGINYRLNPANAGVLSVAGLNCCALANNHILDWGPAGLAETLETLHAIGIKTVGAGREASEAVAPALFELAGNRRVAVFGTGSSTAGIPPSWEARDDRPGVNFLSAISRESAAALAAQIEGVKRPGDVVVASVHWGPNWGYEIDDDQIAFAHAVIEGGADVVFCHSAHHPKAIEVHRGKLVLYGCGDLINDYEGIGGYESYRDDLSLMYFPVIGEGGALLSLHMAPFQIRRFRLNRASASDAAWLAETLTREGGKFGTRVRLTPENLLALDWR